ncbi:MAG: replication initiator protein [Microviridae sp.]|nr:MAG: replication initiator protein [Microviridae sp.]
MKCLSPLYLEQGEVGCGQCMPCRVNKSRLWTGRLLMEQNCWPMHMNYFVTLTYDEEHVPTAPDGTLTLSKPDGVAFRKALYHRIGNKLRYFLVGEYGDDFDRPHFHMMAFGYPEAPDFTTDPTKDPVSAMFKKSWDKGFVTASYATGERAAYICGYTTKKITGAKADTHYGSRLPEYSQMSRRPALGDHFVQRLSLYLKSPQGGRYLVANGDVPNAFTMRGKQWPIGDRHRRMLRNFLDLPPTRREVYADRGELPPLPPVDPAEFSTRSIRYEKTSARRAVFQSRTQRLA